LAFYRYVSSKTDESSSLFFSSGTTFEEYAEGGHYRMTKADKREDIIMIASEPLTFEQRDWMEVKNNTMVVITPKVSSEQTEICESELVRCAANDRKRADFGYRPPLKR
jgi:predicted glutamine amidotransferase